MDCLGISAHLELINNDHITKTVRFHRVLYRKEGEKVKIENLLSFNHWARPHNSKCLIQKLEIILKSSRQNTSTAETSTLFPTYLCT